MDIFYYVFHRMYNFFRGVFGPPITRYREFKSEVRKSGKKFWREK